MFTPHGTISAAQLLPPLLLLAVALAFWGWMFRDMITNDELPPSAKENWTFVFVLLNIFAAVIYYSTIYRNRR